MWIPNLTDSSDSEKADESISPGKKNTFSLAANSQVWTGGELPY